MSSFAIKYRGTLLDLEEDSYLTVDWFSTVFNESEIFRGSYSYAVKLKLSNKNKAILRMPHRLENRLSRLNYDVTILLFGHTWKNAILEIEVHPNTLSGNLLIDNATIADVLKETTLPDLFSRATQEGQQYETVDIGADISQRAQYMLNAAADTDGNYPMVFPMFRNYGWDGVFDSGNQSLINRFDARSKRYLVPPGNPLYCPMFYLVYVVRWVCDRLGFVAEGDFFNEPEIARWIIFNHSYYTVRQMMDDDFKIIIGRHLPKISIGDFFKILRNDLRLPIYFDSLRKTATIGLSLTYLESNDYIDLRGQTIRESLKIKNSTIKQYSVTRAKNNNDQVLEYFDSIDSMTIGHNENRTKVELSISSPKMSEPYQDRFNSIVYRLPIVEQLGNVYDHVLSATSAFNKEGEFNKNDFALSLLSYRGLLQAIPDDDDHVLPYATSDNKNPLAISDEVWLATSPFGSGGWLRRLVEAFYQMLCLSEQVELDAYIPIQNFMAINPLSKSRYRSDNGAINTLLMDKITFEPAKRNSLVLSRIYAYTLPRVEFLLGKGFQFEIETKTTRPDTIYVFAQFRYTRTEWVEGGSEVNWGRIWLQFFSDRYRVHQKSVSDLTVKLEVRRYIRTAASEGTIYFDYEFTTDTNVNDFLSEDEYPYWSNATGSAFHSTIDILQPEDNSYIPV